MTAKEKTFLVDTSVVIEGMLTKLISEKKVSGTIIIHKAVIGEIEHQANFGRETGFRGLEELTRLNELAAKGAIAIEYVGQRPSESQIKRARSGEIDAMIRDAAWERKATLVTGDVVQGKTAKAMGMEVMVLREDKKVDKRLGIEDYFDEHTMSIHLKEGVEPYVKKGKPGEFEFIAASSDILEKARMKDLIDEIILKTHFFDDTFIEIDRKYSTIVQYADIRIVITRPPFSDGLEITAVRPLVQLELTDYKLDPAIVERFEQKAEGILIAGSPGSGKTTFARGLAEFYEGKGKIVKTVESPRDLDLKPAITQYSKNFGTSSEIHDILLLSRPDYTIFDEVRDTKDFSLYSDLRLSGIGMVGVLHSTTPIDAIQRFIGRIELGVIPSVLDTVVFVQGGQIHQVLELVMTVKVPSGMIEADLARPVVEVRDFVTKTLLYELYTYGEQTVVVPVKKQQKTGITKMVETNIAQKVRQNLPKNSFADVELVGNNAVIVKTDSAGAKRIIGREGQNVKQLEKELGVRIDVRTDRDNHEKGEQTEETPNAPRGAQVKYGMHDDKNYYYFELKKSAKGRNVSFYADDAFIFDAVVSRKGTIRVSKKGGLGERIAQFIEDGVDISLYL
ncbi:ATPase [archaeon CG10_big_fil_rev_8_21_14_0_10_43_11]|nr:MAG: ATPase [archaeon CG10_big_fil_rev_8_21_14_0_10_43_11]